MGKVYTIISGKGGVGKTTTAVNLGAALNKFHEDAIVVDANLTTPNIGLHFGAPLVPVSLNHVLQGKADIEEAIYEHESGTKIVPCSLSLKDLKKINTKDIGKISEQLKDLSEFVIFDSAAGLGEEARVSMDVADEIIVITNPNILSVTDALKTIKLAEELKKNVRGVVITRVNSGKSEMSIRNIKEMLEVPILGVVPEDKCIPESLVKKDAVIHTKPRAKSARAYIDLAAKILGKKKIPDSLAVKILRAIGLK